MRTEDSSRSRNALYVRTIILGWALLVEAPGGSGAVLSPHPQYVSGRLPTRAYVSVGLDDWRESVDPAEPVVVGVDYHPLYFHVFWHDESKPGDDKKAGGLQDYDTWIDPFPVPSLIWGRWQFGDGQGQTGAWYAVWAEHEYQAPGFYEVTWTAADVIGPGADDSPVDCPPSGYEDAGGSLFLRVVSNANDYVVYVKEDGTGLGTSWADAMGSIQDAIIQAAGSARSEVWVAQGTYRPEEGGSIVLQDGVAVYGGYQGNETERSQRRPELYATIIDGNLEECAVLAPSGVGAGCVISGFIITGSATYGVYCEPSAAPTISRNRITGNGRGLSCTGEPGPLIRGNVITANTGNPGAGIRCYGSTAVICDNEITYNGIGSGGPGGGILCE